MQNEQSEAAADRNPSAADGKPGVLRSDGSSVPITSTGAAAAESQSSAVAANPTEPATSAINTVNDFAPAESLVEADGADLKSKIVNGALNLVDAVLAAAEGDVAAVVPLVEDEAMVYLQRKVDPRVIGVLQSVVNLGAGTTILGQLNVAFDDKAKLLLSLVQNELKSVASSL